MANRSRRSRELAAIHTIKSKLGMSDDDYRAALVHVVGVNSAGKIQTSDGRQRFIEHLRELERRMGLATRSASAPRRTRRGSEMGFRDEDSPREKKVRMQWLHLVDLGAVETPTQDALNAWIRRQGWGVDHINWLENSGQINTCIEALKRWIERVENDTTT
ncbi:MAG: regulatory protein GemA [Bacteroidota bacterium]